LDIGSFPAAVSIGAVLAGPAAGGAIWEGPFRCKKVGPYYRSVFPHFFVPRKKEQVATKPMNIQ
jgi:hypothetical protein